MRSVKLAATALMVSNLLVTSAALADDDNRASMLSVREFGAKCNGVHDDTAHFKAAVRATPVGGKLTVPEGRCVLTDTIVIDKPMQLSGVGFGSQIYGNADKTMIQVRKAHNVIIKDLFLGSKSNAPGVSLLELSSTHRSQVSNIIMAGGYYGLHLYGALLNTISDLRSATNNAVPFFAPTAKTDTWVFTERSDQTGFPGADHYSSNTNTFIAPVLEGGNYGIVVQDGQIGSDGRITDGGGEGSINILGGTMEGIKKVGLYFKATFLPSSASGIHFEANGQDVVLEAASNIRISSILSINGITLIDHPVTISSGLIVSNLRNIQVSDSVVDRMTIPATAKRIALHNITSGIAVCGPLFGLPADNPNILIDPAADPVERSNIGLYCGAQ